MRDVFRSWHALLSELIVARASVSNHGALLGSDAVDARLLYVGVAGWERSWGLRGLGPTW